MLYISDLIKPPTIPEYGKLHVGIYIAGIQDAIDCKRQELCCEPPSGSPSDNDPTDGDKHEDNQHRDPGGPKGNPHRGSQGG